MTLEPLDYPDGDTGLTALVARPAGAPRAAILVFPTIMNTTPAVETGLTSPVRCATYSVESAGRVATAMGFSR